MAVQFADEEAIRRAIQDVRSDASPTDWVLLSYESSKSQVIQLVGSGAGGVAELVEHLNPEMVGFALVRKVDKIDESETVKFAFILYIGSRVGTMQKARISVHSGGVKTLVGMYHVDISATSLDEISDDIIQSRIAENSGSASRVLDDSGNRKAVSAAGGSGVRKPAAAGRADNQSNVQFVEIDELRAHIRELRAGDINWVLFGYEGGNSNSIVLIGKGNGGGDELATYLNPETVGYGLVRDIDRIGESDTIKFAFINFIGENIPRMLRARLGTHSGAIKEFLTPYHVDINATQVDEVSSQIVNDKIRKTSGTKSNVLEDGPRSPAARPTPAAHRPGPGAVPRSPSSGGGVSASGPRVVQGAPTVNIPEDLRSHVQDVRNDASATNWVLITYEGGNSNTLSLLGSGSGGVDELVGYLRDDIVAYGLARVIDRRDDNDTVKFAWVNWIGQNIPRMLRAKLGTHSGAVKELFNPYHTWVDCEKVEEISHDIIMHKVRTASGTAVHVLN